MTDALSGLGRSSRARWCAASAVILGLWCGLAGAGCVETSPADDVEAGCSGSSGLFGGTPTPVNPEGGEPGASPPVGGSANPPGRCAAVPESDEARIDNFEDGDDFPIAAPGRRGAWHIPPLTGAQKLSFVVEPSGADGSDYAAHVTMDGFTERVSVSASLRFDQEGVSCPYNANGYVGVAFYAKGSGDLDLMLDTTDTWSSEFGGTCNAETEQCWDLHHKLVPLTNEWAYHEVRWDLFSQAGWGKLATLAPDHFLGLEFAVAASSLPADFWIDEVRFIAP